MRDWYSSRSRSTSSASSSSSIRPACRGRGGGRWCGGRCCRAFQRGESMLSRRGCRRRSCVLCRSFRSCRRLRRGCRLTKAASLGLREAELSDSTPLIGSCSPAGDCTLSCGGDVGHHATSADGCGETERDGGGGDGGNGGGGGVGSGGDFGGGEGDEGGAIITGNGRSSEGGPLAGAATHPRGTGKTTAPAAAIANRASFTVTVAASGDVLGRVSLSAGTSARAMHAAWHAVRDGRLRGDSASVGVRLAGRKASSPGAADGRAQLEGKAGGPLERSDDASRASRVVRQRGVRREDHAAVSTALTSRGERSEAAHSSPPEHGIGSGLGMAAAGRGGLPRMPEAALCPEPCHINCGGCVGAEQPRGSEYGLRVKQLPPGT